MFKSFRTKAANLNKQSQENSDTTFLPENIRSFIRLLSGGDDWPSRFMRGYLWKYRLLIVLALLTNLMTTVFELSSISIFFLALQTISEGLNESSTLTSSPFGQWFIQLTAVSSPAGLFFGLVLLAVILQIARSGFQFLGHVFFATATSRIEGDIRTSLVEQYFSLDYQEISSKKIGDLAIYPAHIQNMGRAIALLNNITVQALLLIGYIGYLVWLSWQTSLVGILFVVVIFFGLQRIRKHIARVSEWQLDAMVAYNEMVLEFLDGARTIHIFNRKAFTHDQTRPVIDHAVKARRVGRIWASTSQPIVEILGAIGLAVFLMIGLRQFQIQGEGVIPVLVTFVAVLSRLIPRAAALNSLAGQTARQWPYVERLANFLRTDNKQYVPTTGQSLTEFKQQILFENVQFSYSPTEATGRNNNEGPVLDSLSFTIDKGKSIAIVGPSGSGKSTLADLVLALHKPQTGQVSVDGIPLDKIKLSDWRAKIGTVDQTGFVFNDTVESNIRFGRLEATLAEIEQAAKIANAHDFISQLPNGYQTPIGNRGERLSGGQRQRIAIARALVRQPEILIFDEATSALDNHSERLVQQAIQELKTDHTIIMIAHRLSTIVWADEILVLDQGKLVERGRHADLISQNGIYAKLWHSQENAS